MSTMPRIVVILPTKNRRPLLERAIESVRAQEGDWRIIIVNDGSTDDTRNFLETVSHDARVRVITLSSSKGVNAARNAALHTLSDGEWGFLLDDDDLLLPSAIMCMQQRIAQTPSRYEYIFFNTRIHAPHRTYVGGYQHAEGEEYHDPTYLEVITKSGLKGDCKPAISAKLIARGYRFAEDVNGFESEFNALVARDGIGIRFYRDQVAHIDQAHGLERLSDTAAVRNPNAFVRVHLRMMKDHRELLREHSALRFARAREGVRVSLRAHDALAVRRFVLELMSAWLSVCCDTLFAFFRNEEDITRK